MNWEVLNVEAHNRPKFKHILYIYFYLWLFREYEPMWDMKAELQSSRLFSDHSLCNFYDSICPADRFMLPKSCSLLPNFHAICWDWCVTYVSVQEEDEDRWNEIAWLQLNFTVPREWVEGEWTCYCTFAMLEVCTCHSKHKNVIGGEGKRADRMCGAVTAAWISLHCVIGEGDLMPHCISAVMEVCMCVSSNSNIIWQRRRTGGNLPACCDCNPYFTILLHVFASYPVELCYNVMKGKVVPVQA